MTGTELRKKRLSINLSQVRMAKEIGLGRSAYRKYEFLYEAQIPKIVSFAVIGYFSTLKIG